jgi:hypothetical protein
MEFQNYKSTIHFTDYAETDIDDNNRSVITLRVNKSLGAWAKSKFLRMCHKINIVKLHSVGWVSSELYRPSDRCMSAKLLPTFANRGCYVVSVTDPYCHILHIQDRSRYFFFQVAPQLYSWGWVDPVLDPLLLRKCSSAGNRTQTSGFVARKSDH